MAKTIGKITFENGSFFIKHPDGTLEVAKVGAMLSEGDVIIGSSSNSNSNLIRVSLIDNSSEIQIVGNNEQLFDITLLSGEIPEDTVVPNSQVGDLLEQATNNQQDPNQNNEQATLTLAQIENLDAAAAGADQTTTEPVGIVPLRLEDRTAGETNVVTDLRDAEETLAVIDDTVEADNRIDDVPTTGVNPTISLDDDTLSIDSIGNPLAVDFGQNGAGSVALTDITADASFGLTSSVAGNVMTISQNGVAVMTITLNSAGGTYTYDVNQIAAINHPDATTEDNIDFTVNYVVTDIDGDTATGTFGIVVNDSVPTGAEQTAATLDDDKLVDNVANNESVTNALNINFGADGAGTVALTGISNATNGLTASVDSNGVMTVSQVQNGTSVDVATVTLSQNNGVYSYTVTQLAAIMTPDITDANVETDAATFTVTYDVTDADGDTIEDTFAVSITDDMPTISPESVILLNEDANTIFNVDLNINYGADGANANNAIILTPTINAQGFLINTSNVALTSTVSGDTYKLVYVTNSNGGFDVYQWTGNLVPTNPTNILSSDSNLGSLVLSVDLNSTNNTYSVELSNPNILDGYDSTQTNIFDSSVSIGGGMEAALLFNISSLYVLATATDSSTVGSVNYSSGNGMGVNTGNSIDGSEVLTLHFTTNQILNSDTANMITDAEANSKNLTDALFTIETNSPGSKNPTANWNVYNGLFLVSSGSQALTKNSTFTLNVSSDINFTTFAINGTNIYASDYTDTNGGVWNLTNGILSYNSTTSTSSAVNVSYVLNGNTITVSNFTMDADESINLTQFNKIDFNEIGAGDGSYTVTSMIATNTEDIDGSTNTLVVNTNVTDGDGDTVTDSFNITFEPNGDITGSNGDDVIDYTGVTSVNGGDGIDTLVLSDGDDTYNFNNPNVTNVEKYDGGDGIDTFILDNSDSINLSNVTRVENIDMTAQGAQSASLSLSDVINMDLETSTITSNTGNPNDNLTGHILKITGDNSDTVNLSDTTGWTQSQTTFTASDNVSYDVYTNDTDQTYKVLIQTDIDTNI